MRGHVERTGAKRRVLSIQTHVLYLCVRSHIGESVGKVCVRPHEAKATGRSVCACVCVCMCVCACVCMCMCSSARLWGGGVVVCALYIVVSMHACQ